MEIRLAQHGRHIAIVTIDNQPHLNAMTRAMLAELGRLWDELERCESRRSNPVDKKQRRRYGRCVRLGI
jgi:enoyl-CoA hydratase/carnithine racemase